VLRHKAGILSARLIAGVGAVLLVVASWSVGASLAAPGTDPVSVRLAEWGRDHGLGFAVTASESVQYWLHPPRVGGRPDTSVLAGLDPSPTASAHPDVVGMHLPLATLVQPGLPGEGVFRPLVMVHGQPALQVAYLRPDAVHTSYLAAVAWMSSRLLRLVLHPGYEEPGDLTLFSQPDTVPVSARAGLVATFNSGFRISDARGGYYADGHTVGTLTPGAASLVVYRDGHADVGAWGGSLRLGPDVVSVRQNLRLLIDDGRLASNLDSDVQSSWGETISGAYFVWRSGIGVTAAGDLVYVAGEALSVHSLAELLLRAGAVRAMQLDINAPFVSFMWYSTGRTATSAQPHKLVAFSRPADRYFAASSRDFYAVYAR
jgi:hypothetical protein